MAYFTVHGDTRSLKIGSASSTLGPRVTVRCARSGFLMYLSEFEANNLVSDIQKILSDIKEGTIGNPQ